ncbi:PSD1 and planctomycete cytochrome C domain-containing protein [Tuwongella immobilis]|uniref:Cytochrome c domain-containing protein n=1 Tax=Tuwongella immobilis TaxID=692036 RepID=A0A6C2YQ84_9BACT|nr:PSD1 and planctomycete cytochrome C domain-containing protein [Tuwongella immobilis]VIP03798.1 colicin uptake protein : Membrane protein involved in colicin uptake OS=Singulisphaera acidiphila (strain ATCC BAA-1392 / DSM 18658 / VKM B-2454 / MOB10) GN=Sinac_2743 PE=4 SV=1: PSCyt1: PSCyt2: PSD1 [Tuwongella immobilis]VTS04963.1 colicin uptake protein : Membrane protein involved in colicin uptake OS=Singulisphaera acidiphila (strain ATCC BAA-1392 / DSM 18658 / VKM B-2454 / MOB10) GN=Sinac_2743 PE
MSRTVRIVAMILALPLLMPATIRAEIDYLKQIKPILLERCYACHGVLKQEGNLRLDTAIFGQKGGDSGPAWKAGKPDASLLLERITEAEEADRMPPEGEPLKPQEIALIRDWIAQGAKAPADEKPETDPKQHWAFQPPVRPAIPTVNDPRWQGNPIDALIAAQREARGLVPQPASNRHLWIRRVTLDLIGLPPTDAEITTFVNDSSPNAYEKVVDRLLASPHYGERWGRHWMDIWRFSDWWGLGAEVRNSHKHMHHYRDWIIESLNADVGYDEMLRQMLAADELHPTDSQKLRATGYLVRNYFLFNRTSWMDETVEHTSKAMLGLTMNCSKCHDHKYDPLSQVEYYRMRAIFEPYQVRMDLLPGVTDPEQNALPRAFDCNLDEKTYLHIRGDDRNPDKSKPLSPGIPSILQKSELAFSPVKLPAAAVNPGLRPEIVQAYRDAANAKISRQREAQAVAKKALAEILAKAPAKPADAPLSPQSPPMKSNDPARADSLKPTLVEDFASAKPERWMPKSGSWKIANGRLTQTEASAMASIMRLNSPVPQDFEATLTYVPTGGETYKSVGLAFDAGESDRHTLVYVSGYAADPKVQVAPNPGGGYRYPAEGKSPVKVELNQPHTLKVQVRNSLVNVWFDGEFKLAYQLPDARSFGSIDLVTYDATAEFRRLELKPLTPSIALRPAGVEPNAASAPIATRESAELALKVADAELAAAEAELAAIEAAHAADLAQANEPGTAATKAKIIAAARAQAQQEQALAEVETAKAAHAVAISAGNAKVDAQKKLQAAMGKRDAATKRLQSPGESYRSIVGSRKSKESNVESDASRNRPFPATSSGRRSAFATWLTSRQNPLAARVAVNHLWSRHFGKPLVATVFDFGRRGAAPTHPELLDWLAVEFMESGWSMKHLHKLMVLSQTYRLSSSNAKSAAVNLQQDAENRHYWRSNPIRMESQVVRDSLLLLAGELDRTMGGPSIPVSNTQSKRRSLYFFHSHNEHQKFLSLFDDASVLDCYRRTESIVPQQALALANSEIALETAEKIAAKIAKDHPQADGDAWLTIAFRTVLGSPPNDAERAYVRATLPKLEAAAREQNRANPQSAARVSIIHALLNHNDFVTIR